MGCAPSKKVDSTTTPFDLYRPPPSSIAVFNVNSIEEPWLKLQDTVSVSGLENQQNPSPPHVHVHVPPPLLEKLNTLDNDKPHTWEEVSKALDDFRKPAEADKNVVDHQDSSKVRRKPRKSFSFHTLAELEGSKNGMPHQRNSLKRAESTHNLSNSEEAKIQLGKTDDVTWPAESNTSQAGGGGGGSLKANPFIQRDRMEREKEGKEAAFDRIMKMKRDPLTDFPEKCPPSGANLVVLYTTSLGGIRRTFDNCNRVRAILQNHRILFDERDVSLHGEFLAELKKVVGEDVAVSVPVPRLFIKGRYLGGADEVVELNETGQLGRILGSARVERGVGWIGCEACGGARFLPCMECGGSCKLLTLGDHKERCPKCNENGLVHCPLCHSN